MREMLNPPLSLYLFCLGMYVCTYVCWLVGWLVVVIVVVVVVVVAVVIVFVSHISPSQNLEPVVTEGMAQKDRIQRKKQNSKPTKMETQRPGGRGSTNPSAKIQFF